MTMVRRIAALPAVLFAVWPAVFQTSVAVAQKQDGITLQMSRYLQPAEPRKEPTTEFKLAPVETNQRALEQHCLRDTPMPHEALSLGDSLSYILCRSPALRQAMLAVLEQRSGQQLVELSGRPQVSLSGDINLSQSPATTLLAQSRARSANVGLAMSWVLFDFGARNANLNAARSTLAATMAAQSQASLVQVSEGLQLYVQAQSAWLRWQGLLESVELSERSVVIANAKYNAGIGALSEKLQVETAQAQSQLELARAYGQWIAARGALALAMGWSIRQPIKLATLALPPASLGSGTPLAFETTAWEQDFSQALPSILQSHPRVRALTAQLEALQARSQAISAESRGSVSLNSSVAANKGLGGTSGREAAQTAAVNLSINVPLLDGPVQAARQSQLSAQIGIRESQLVATQRDIEQELWRAMQQIQLEQQQLGVAQTLLKTAVQSYDVALSRYKAGVGTVLELLIAQAARSNAAQQIGLSQVAVLQAQVRLSLARGDLGPLGSLRSTRPLAQLSP